MQVGTKIGLVFCLVLAPATLSAFIACGGGSTCGNGIIDGGESCDDANFNEQDGCNMVCQLDSRLGELCHPIPNRPAPRNAGRVGCRPSAAQPCIRCALIGGGITGENATWDSCYPDPNPVMGAQHLAGQPNCVQSGRQTCIPCSGSRQIPGTRPMSLRLDLDTSLAFCGDGEITPPETCDPEHPPGRESADTDCLDKNCGLNGR
jgi:cysteine-rich repeat protein